MGGSKLGAPTNVTCGPLTGSLFGTSKPADYKSNISAADSSTLKLNLFEQSAEVKEQDVKFQPDKEVSIENKNKFFAMLKQITPETTPRHLDRKGAEEDEESKNLDAKSQSEISGTSVLRREVSKVNKNKFFEMLNAINPEKQKEGESEEKKPGAVLNQDLEVEIEETKTEPKETDLIIEKAQSQQV